jgi:hypothetical protein
VSEKLFRLDVSCPKCGAPPPVRVYQADVASKRDMPPDERVLTVQCNVCKLRYRRITVYEITAAAYHGAA